MTVTLQVGPGSDLILVKLVTGVELRDYAAAETRNHDASVKQTAAHWHRAAAASASGHGLANFVQLVENDPGAGEAAMPGQADRQAGPSTARRRRRDWAAGGPLPALNVTA